MSSQHDSPVDVLSIATPANVLFFFIGIILVYLYGRTKTIIDHKSGHSYMMQTPSTRLFQVYTPPVLSYYDGTDNKPIYLAVRGKVYDVTPGKDFYGPGGPYENFAGRDASRGLACGSFAPEMLTSDLTGPLDPLDNLDSDQIEALDSWEARFSQKYIAVGRLVACGDQIGPNESLAVRPDNSAKI